MQRKPVRYVQSRDLNQTKFTPRSRPAHQSQHSGQLINADPEKKYVWAPIDERNPFSWAFYESMGYQPEMVQKDGKLKVVLGSKPVVGKIHEWGGMYLMSCSKEHADKLFMEGPTGNTGQQYQDRIMATIKQGNLERRERISGLQEVMEFGDLEETSIPQFRNE